MEAIAQEIADRSVWRKTTDTYSRIYQAALLGAARASARDPKAQALADALRALRNEAWVNLSGGRGDLIDDASAALAAWDAKP